MKKLISIILAVLTILAFASCGNNNTPADTNADTKAEGTNAGTKAEENTTAEVTTAEVTTAEVTTEEVTTVPAVEPVVQDEYKYKGYAVNDSNMQAYLVYITFYTKGGSYTTADYDQKSTSKAFFTTWPTGDGFTLIAKDKATKSQKEDLVADAKAWYGDVVPSNVTFDDLYDKYFDQIGGIVYNGVKYLSLSGGGMFVTGAYEYSVSGTDITVGKTLVKPSSSDVAYTIKSIKWSEDHKTLTVSLKFSKFTKELTLDLVG